MLTADLYQKISKEYSDGKMFPLDMDAEKGVYLITRYFLGYDYLEYTDFCKRICSKDLNLKRMMIDIIWKGSTWLQKLAINLLGKDRFFDGYIPDDCTAKDCINIIFNYFFTREYVNYSCSYGQFVTEVVLGFLYKTLPQKEKRKLRKL